MSKTKSFFVFRGISIEFSWYLNTGLTLITRQVKSWASLAIGQVLANGQVLAIGQVRRIAAFQIEPTSKTSFIFFTEAIWQEGIV